MAVRDASLMMLPPEQRSDKNIGGGYSQFVELDIRETNRLNVDNVKGILFVNQYLVVKDIGRGSHGGVKLCLSTEDNTLYAMKVVDKEYVRRRNKMAMYQQGRMRAANGDGRQGASMVTAFSGASESSRGGASDQMLELAVMRRLDHPNVVRLYEVVDDQEVDKLLMIMEYVDGGSILPATMSTRRIPLAEEVALQYFVDVVRGVEYLHRHGIVHGDIKPSNLLLSSHGRVKITDFGSSSFSSYGELIGRTGGSPAFLSPEICTGQPYVGFPADMWALGVTLYMLVFGTVPFQAGTIGQLYDMIRDQPVVFPDGADLSPALLDLLRRLLNKDPRSRLRIEDVKLHPWVTRDGTAHLPRNPSDRFMKKLRAATPDMNQAVHPAVSFRKTVLSEGEEVIFEDGEYLIRTGHLVRGIFFILEGTCELYHQPANVRKANMLIVDHDFIDLISESDEDDYDSDPILAPSDSGVGSIASLGSNVREMDRLDRIDTRESRDRHRSADGGRRSAEGRRSAGARPPGSNGRDSSAPRRRSQQNSLSNISVDNLMGLLPGDTSILSPMHTLPPVPGAFYSSMDDNPYMRPSSAPSASRSQSPHRSRERSRNSSSHSSRRSRQSSLRRSHSFGGSSNARSIGSSGRLLRRAETYSNLNNQAALWRKAVNRTASMQQRVMQLVLESSKTTKLKRVTLDVPTIQLVSRRGPSTFVGGINIDGMPKISDTTVVAKGRVRALLIKSEQVKVLWNQPLVRAAIARADTDTAVMDTLEMLGEFESDMRRIDALRKKLISRSASLASDYGSGARTPRTVRPEAPYATRTDPDAPTRPDAINTARGEPVTLSRHEGSNLSRAEPTVLSRHEGSYLGRAEPGALGRQEVSNRSRAEPAVSSRHDVSNLARVEPSPLGRPEGSNRSRAEPAIISRREGSGLSPAMPIRPYSNPSHGEPPMLTLHRPDSLPPMRPMPPPFARPEPPTPSRPDPPHGDSSHLVRLHIGELPSHMRPVPPSHERPLSTHRKPEPLPPQPASHAGIRSLAGLHTP